jgi:hypothetical protein
MSVLFSVALLVLSASMVIGFAMIGEVSSRIPLAAQNDAFYAIDDCPVGAERSAWIESTFGSNVVSDILVMSSSCSSCSMLLDDAPDLSEILGGGLAILLSCPTYEQGAAYADQRLSYFPDNRVVIDVGGARSIEHLRVNSSPALVRFDSGLISGAWEFATIPGLRSLVESNPRKSGVP